MKFAIALLGLSLIVGAAHAQGLNGDDDQWNYRPPSYAPQPDQFTGSGGYSPTPLYQNYAPRYTPDPATGAGGYSPLCVSCR